ncbi:MAG: hypothetical protein Kow0059_13540 [Candidatus Sumerlaeia bacterium]
MILTLLVGAGRPAWAQPPVIDGVRSPSEPYTAATNSAPGIDTNADFGFGDAAKVERLLAADDGQFLYIFAEGSLHSSNRLFVLLDSDAAQGTGWSGPHPDGAFAESDALEYFTDVADGGWDLTISVEAFGNPPSQLFIVALAYDSDGALNSEVFVGQIAGLSGSLSNTVRGRNATLFAALTPGDAPDTGIELAVPRAWLAAGAGGPGGSFRLAALNGNHQNNFWSNSTIPDNPLTGADNIGFADENRGVLADLTAPVFAWTSTAAPTPTPSPTPPITPTPTPSPTAGPTSITIGPGPEIGSTAGITYYEEFQDWRREDCRGLDPWGDSADLGDAARNARDLVALYSRDDPAADSVFFRVDLLDNFFQAEEGGLDVYLLLDLGSPGEGAESWPDQLTGQPNVRWEVAVAVYSAQFWSIYDKNGAVLSSQTSNPGLFRGAYFHGDLDAVEFGVARTLLTAQGWDGSTPILMQAATAKDFGSAPADTLPDAGAGAVSSADQSATAKFAFILHGNQAISSADSIQNLIWNETVRTPNDRPTGYRRALETARLFRVPPSIHVSATLLASALWAERPGQSDPQDGPAFVQLIRDFLDGDPANGEGSIVWGVLSEHIMPFFEGAANLDSIALNEAYLRSVLGLPAPAGDAVFWIPERVTRGSTFADLAAAGYGWTVLDQTQHLRAWFGENGQGFKIHRINGVNCFLINDTPDRFKFANTDGGLWLDTRRHLIDMARSADQEQITVVFDDWEAYAGRSFLSFNQGNDNPDNFNTNIRWMANHQWIQIVSLQQAAGWGWTPVDHGTNAALPFETYDFLDFATEDNYENWYKGSAGEEGFDDFQPWIRQDRNERAVKPFGALQSYVNSTTGAVGGPGTIAEDTWAALAPTPDNALKTLARLAWAAAVFETAWHNEDSAVRCGEVFCAYDCEGTCDPDPTFDAIADFARQLQMLNLRRGGLITAAAQWAATGNQGTTTATAADLDHDGENEFVLKNDLVFAVFENDGGRLIAAFARDPQTTRAAQLIGNLLGFPDRDDEREADTNQGARRVSGLSDWWAAGPDTNQYVNDVYSAEEVSGGWRFTSSDGRIQKTITLGDGSHSLEVAYVLNPVITTLYVRFGLSPDPLNLIETGQSALQLTDTAGRLTLANSATGAAVSLDYAGPGHSALYNAAAGDGTPNSPRNMALLHMVELSGAGDFSFGLVLSAGESPGNRSDGWLLR